MTLTYSFPQSSHVLHLHRSVRQGIGLLLVLIGSIAVCVGSVKAQSAGGAGSEQPPAVTVVTVEQRNVSQSFDFIGRVEAVEAVDVHARVEGFVEEVAFREGQDVVAGDVLFRIEREEYEAVLQAAKAERTRAEARLRRAERDLERGRTLLERGNISQAAVDEFLAARDTAAADIQAAEASIRQAELDLNYTTITAAIDGRIGEALFTKGNLVSAESGPLARIVRLEPIRVVFSVTDRGLLWAWTQTGAESMDDLQHRFVPGLKLADDSAYPHEGVIAFVDNEMDPQTGTVAVFTRFPNPRRKLLPGQLVTVVSRLAEEQKQPVVPQAAIQRDREGAFVLVVGDDNRVTRRRVTLGEQVDTVWAIDSGLQLGELVVTQGIQKVKPGTQVEPVFAETGG